MFDVIKSWEILAEGKKRSLALPVNAKVEEFIQRFSNPLPDSQLNKLASEKHDIIAETFALTTAPDLKNKVLDLAADVATAPKREKK